MPKSSAPCDVHPGVVMVQEGIAALPEKTGRTLDEWIAVVKKDGPKDCSARRSWLKSKHNLGPNSAWWIAERAVGKGGDEDSPEQYLATAVNYVDAQYAVKKTHLRPIFEELVELGRSLGKDVKICPCKTIVPLYRSHLFAQIRPTSNARIDLGLCFSTYDRKLPERLVDTGGLAKKDRITHRIELPPTNQIDADLTKWLKLAYSLDQYAFCVPDRSAARFAARRGGAWLPTNICSNDRELRKASSVDSHKTKRAPQLSRRPPT